jgi:transposase
MGKTRKAYPREFKMSVVNQVIGGSQISQVARENGIHPTLLTRWKREYTHNPNKAFGGNGNAYKDQARLAELERLVGKLYAENDFLKKVLDRLGKRVQEEKEKTDARRDIQ